MAVTRLYFDGGCSPNPGHMSACIVIQRDGQDPEAHMMNNLGWGTNNVAEWSGLVWAGRWAKENGLEMVEFFGDSMLVIQQAQGVWRAKDTTLNLLREEFRDVTRGIEMRLQHVPRAENLAGIYLEQRA